MSTSKLFCDFAVKLHALTAQVGGAVYVDGILDMGINSQLQSRVDVADGAVYGTFGALVSGAPVGRFSTNDLKALLDQAGLEGMKIDQDGTHPGVVLYAQKYKEGGTREAISSAVHLSWTIANGILVPRTLELSHQRAAQISAEVIARKAGAVAPVVFSATDQLPAASPSVDVEWTLGPVKLNAVTIDGVESVGVDFGIDVAAEGSDSDTYPTFTGIRRIQPVITLQGVHADQLSTLTVDGAFYSATQVVLYARKLSEGGTFVADGTAQHVKLTLGKCRVDWDSVGGDPKRITMRLTPWYTVSGAVSPMAINTASAIT